ncbi:hypothetical protein DFO66_11174 [Brevibacterium sanguinis]|uniref:DUF559 domain-containing protein n=2 Tax=Brevibacterium TaxID=1696 RepID=A0A366IEF6_9MICO|nr:MULTISPECIES: hypothetical protein [Brevibacterium]RBP63152.1 hypothetical protein DFO66_11174 [Brevibacterium sanguinis]RBP69672.1 hypothetical protein DFO65_11132 [Brevibacterium celere]
MYNIVRTAELSACGIDSRVIRSALSCCLLRLSYGVFTIVSRCQDFRHSRIAALITDDEWITRSIEHRAREGGGVDFDYLGTVEKLRIASYPHYRDGDVICGTSAAVIHELPMRRLPRGPITIAHPSARRKSEVISRTTREIPQEDIVHVGKMVLTSPVRTSFDLIAILGEAEAFAALEHTLRRAVFGADPEIGRCGYPPDTSEWAAEKRERLFRPCLERLPTRRRRALRLLEHAGPLSESYAESRCSYDLLMLGLREFEQQVEIYDGRQRLARVDFLHRGSKTILMVDGAGKYVLNGFPLMRRESDQHNRLLALGYRIVRFSFDDVIDLEAFATKLFMQAPHLRQWQRP